ncbi:MAG: hypothetical protein PHH56_00830 [Candidatus Pacebacteria bacterium]|nr:hypothetical protein [Candidatus Paceibacterota bacterium]
MKQKNIQPHTKQEQGAKSAKVDKVSSRYGVRVYFYTNLLAWTLALLLIGNYAFGWTIPTSNPPGGDLSAPLDVSSTAQTKAGDLTIDGLLKVGRYSSAPIGSIGALYFDTTADEFKGYKSTGWDSIGGGGGGIWTQSGTNIYYSTGNVGIGTTVPGTSLEVNGKVKAPYFITSSIDGDTFTGTWTTGYNNAVHYYGLSDFNVDGTNFGVALSGYGGLAFYTGYNASASAPDVVINTSGNVGIGTTEPSEKLEVSGNIKLSGASPTYKMTNVAAPTASSDVATKEYVDASVQTLYITTTRGAASSCVDYPSAYCPDGWTIVTSWTYKTNESTTYSCGSSLPGQYQAERWRETLCSK